MPSQPGPYQVEITYSGDSRSHKMRLDCRIDGSPVAGVDMSTVNVLNRLSANIGLTSAVGSFIDLLQPIFAPDMSFDSFSLWKFTSGTNERQFIGSALIGEVGTNAGVIQRAHQTIYTFRSGNGGTMRLNLLEDSNTGNDKTAYADMSAPAQALVDFMLSDDCWIYSRDNAYPIVSLWESQGQNEAIWRKIYRQ